MRVTQKFYTRIYTTLLSVLDENIKKDKRNIFSAENTRNLEKPVFSRH